MDRKCVIIGAGLGGLSCGAILARHGFEVTVLEQERKVGGCLQTFVREGVKFETGMHFIGSAARGEILDTMLRFIGIRDGLVLHALDRDCYDIINYKGQDFPFRNGREAFVEGLSQYFPGSRDSLAAYIETVYRVSDALSVESFNPERGLDAHDSEWHRRSVNSVIDELIEERDLREVLVGNQPLYAGVRGSTPFALHAFTTSFYNRSAWRIEGGSDRIAALLEKCIIDAGGEVMTRCRAVEIVCNETRATGVKYICGGVSQTIEADTVISTAHPSISIGMVKSPLLRPVFRKRIEDMPDTIGVFELYLKFKQGKVPYMNSNRFVYRGGTVWDSECYTNSNWPLSFLYMHQYPQFDANYADAGVILAYMRMDELSRWSDTVTGRRGEEYEEFKRVKAATLIEAASDCLPELKDGLERYWTSTPLTYRDYTGTRNGSLYGIAKDVKLGAAGRVSFRTRVPNLFLAGQSVNSHGILGVLMGSFVVCDNLLGSGVMYEGIRSSIL
ncbi:MAG: NAD(P)/FAD-dependent oxidoreductase [Bacteroidales bacterium]|jgi:all-trans-retinol 13,14-reductase|nr:NAD(P)/FAD-dependent oxidoreductase [Bacteroidales bacterium]